MFVLFSSKSIFLEVDVKRKDGCDMPSKKTPHKRRVLILGFFDRCNLGDEAYKKIFGNMFDNNHSEYRCVGIDDYFTVCEERCPILQSPNTIIVGGGDLVNEYFYTRVRDILHSYCLKTPCYLVSVGIPYESDVIVRPFLALFDHVFVRSTGDAEIAKAMIGTDNVTQVRDLVFNMPHIRRTPKASNIYKLLKPKFDAHNTHIAVCLAQPMFVHACVGFLESLCGELANVIRVKNAVLHLIPFNTFENCNESDLVLNDRIAYELLNTHCISGEYIVNYGDFDRSIIRDVLGMADVFGKMKCVIVLQHHDIIVLCMQ